MKIKILNIDYEIKEFESGSRNDTAMGHGDSKLATLHICKDMPKKLKRTTLLHEIIHQVSERLNLELNETQVCGLETGLFPFFENFYKK